MLPDVVRGALSVSWTADGSGFFYAHRPSPKAGEDPDAARMEKSLFHHALGQPQERDRLVREWKDGFRWAYTMLSDDGRRLIAVASRGPSDFLYAIDLKNAREYHAGEISDFSRVGVEVADDHTLVLTLNRATPYFPAMLFHQAWMPVHRASGVDPTQVLRTE